MEDRHLVLRRAGPAQQAAELPEDPRRVDRVEEPDGQQRLLQVGHQRLHGLVGGGLRGVGPDLLTQDGVEQGDGDGNGLGEVEHGKRRFGGDSQHEVAPVEGVAGKATRLVAEDEDDGSCAVPESSYEVGRLEDRQVLASPRRGRSDHGAGIGQGRFQRTVELEAHVLVGAARPAANLIAVRVGPRRDEADGGDAEVGRKAQRSSHVAGGARLHENQGREPGHGWYTIRDRDFRKQERGRVGDDGTGISHMLIPIGHEETTVRRWPVVTIGIMVLCLLALIATKMDPAASGAAIQRAFDRAVRFYFEHPYLELDPRLEKQVFGGVREEEAGAFREVIKQTGKKPPADKALLREEQAQLDRLTERAFATVQEHPFFRWGLVPKDPGPVTFVTHMFMHAGWFHLIGNMLILYLSGPFLEDRWGRPLFAAFYLSGGIVAALAFVAQHPDSSVPLVGASGAVAACMGAFLIRFWKTKIRFFYWFGLVFRGTFNAPAWLMLPLWLAKEMVFADAYSRMQGGGDGVAHIAHVGGFLFGMAVAAAIGYFRIEDRFLNPVLEQKVTLADNREIDEAHELFARGEKDRALALLKRVAVNDPANVDATVAWWSLASECGREAEVAPAMKSLIRRELRAGETDLAATHWLELASRLPEEARDPSMAARVAEHLLSEGRDEDVRAVLEIVAPAVDAGTPPGLLARLARVAMIVGGESAADMILRLAAQHPEIPEEDRERFREALAERPGGVAPAAVPEKPAAAGASSIPEAEDRTSGESEAPEIRPAVAEVWQAQRRLRVAEAVPVAVTATSIRFRLANGQERELPLEQVQAVAVAGIQPPGGKAYLLLDLCLDSPWGEGQDLRVVRCTSLRFDPRKLLGLESTPLEAFRALVDIVLKGSDGTPLPGPEAVAGRPFATFPDLESYAQEVLGAS